MSRAARKPQGRAELAVDSRVSTTYNPDESGKPRRVTGVIVQDFAAAVDATEGKEFGRDWALTHRWAIRLDDGPLVFRDDADVEQE